MEQARSLEEKLAAVNSYDKLLHLLRSQRQIIKQHYDEKTGSLVQVDIKSQVITVMESAKSQDKHELPKTVPGGFTSTSEHVDIPRDIRSAFARVMQLDSEAPTETDLGINTVAKLKNKITTASSIQEIIDSVISAKQNGIIIRSSEKSGNKNITDQTLRVLTIINRDNWDQVNKKLTNSHGIYDKVSKLLGY